MCNHSGCRQEGGACMRPKPGSRQRRTGTSLCQQGPPVGGPQVVKITPPKCLLWSMSSRAVPSPHAIWLPLTLIGVRFGPRTLVMLVELNTATFGSSLIMVLRVSSVYWRLETVFLLTVLRGTLHCRELAPAARR